MIQYRQAPPLLSRDGVPIKTSILYSGWGKWKNDPASEALKGLGCIPRGRWRLVRWDEHHADKGPVVAVLEPVGHDAHGRSAFLIHGDSIAHPGFASHGCIIADRATRDAWRATGDMDLEVV